DSETVIVLRPFLSRHAPDVLEVVSAINLRERFGIRDGSEVKVKLICGALPQNA
ncbi:MAG: DUF120 domain-containing protein, partial [Desulfurococcales archaeon]|nr:DUF120 domain-containing protein [Desulfurococcales archaeon]